MKNNIRGNFSHKKTLFLLSLTFISMIIDAYNDTSDAIYKMHYINGKWEEGIQIAGGPGQRVVVCNSHSGPSVGQYSRFPYGAHKGECIDNYCINADEWGGVKVICVNKPGVTGMTKYYSCGGCNKDGCSTRGKVIREGLPE